MAHSAIFSLGALINVPLFYLSPDFQLVLLFGLSILTVAVTFALVFFIRDAPICMVAGITLEQTQRLVVHRYNKQKGRLQPDSAGFGRVRVVYKARTVSKQLVGKVFTNLDFFRYESLRRMTLVMAVINCTSELI